ncbi:hypothetical protein [Falsiroseomonas stagni]|uniref:Antitoxin ParD1/3/4 n=1 Tax=Falsiroseomonas stagni DSM 19981 TaxID=1123062 RepID=A0A1I3Z692_9PROT|nr:hypothetical protein [Falsiroseomonas stagni]SFK39191.1 hypothetical protein SAMN02745775_102178 [Falsiroseomonas stagni DSM 19981]
MRIEIGDRFKGVIAAAVESGPYTSPEDVVPKGVVTGALGLFAADQPRHQALRDSIAEALADPRRLLPEEVDRALDAPLRAEGRE